LEVELADRHVVERGDAELPVGEGPHVLHLGERPTLEVGA
jgi:hypothetical protein